MGANGTSAIHIDDVETFNKVRNPVIGSTKLITDCEVILVPTPTNDPNGKSVQNRSHTL
jgi:hypothetical protein